MSIFVHAFAILLLVYGLKEHRQKRDYDGMLDPILLAFPPLFWYNCPYDSHKK